MSFSGIDPTIAPAGRHQCDTVVAVATVSPQRTSRLGIGRRGGGRPDRRRDGGFRTPGSPIPVLDRFIQTPRDIESELGMIGGNVMHVEMSLDQMMLWRTASGTVRPSRSGSRRVVSDRSIRLIPVAVCPEPAVAVRLESHCRTAAGARLVVGCVVRAGREGHPPNFTRRHAPASMTGYATAGTMTTVQQSTDPAAKPTSRKRFLTVAALALMLVPLLAGCIRVQVSMGVSANDRVTGQVVAAAIPANEADKGPQLTPPSSLEDKIRVQSTRRTGTSAARRSSATCPSVTSPNWAPCTPRGPGSFQITLKRSGDTVTLDGKADLKTVPTQGADVQVSIAFPARVGTTNGTRDGDSRVSWTLPAGEVSTMRAEVNYADPSTRSFAGWAGIMAGLALGVAIVVGAMAGWRAIEHRSSARPPRKHRS